MRKLVSIVERQKYPSSIAIPIQNSNPILRVTETITFARIIMRSYCHFVVRKRPGLVISIQNHYASLSVICSDRNKNLELR